MIAQPELARWNDVFGLLGIAAGVAVLVTALVVPLVTRG
jgi:hypothetical protein